MLLSMRKNEEQKELFYDLDWFFKKCSEDGEKTKGVYAIYKDDICLYVGQSKNIPSRIATHLSGKYANVDKILIYVDSEYIDESSENTLTETEKYLINRLKPIENVLVDFSCEIDNALLFGQFTDLENGAPVVFGSCHRFAISQNKKEITVYDISTCGGDYALIY